MLLEVENLTTSFMTEDGRITAIEDISFNVDRGKTLCIVGESGCGKSVTSLSIMQLIPSSNGSIDSGRICLDGLDLLRLNHREMRKVRGNKIAMIFQEPMTALNPVLTVGQQISEVFEIHENLSGSAKKAKTLDLLKQVSIPDPEQRLNEYPHQLSGGMKQRVMIAMALACNPELLIADEPTTALDVTVQAQILKLMKDLQQRTNTAMIFITHDLGVVAEVADDVAVMYAGKIIEQGSVYEIFENPRHPYTVGLLKSIPTPDIEPRSHLYTIKGMVPSLKDLPPGCRFQDRCPRKQKKCEQELPSLEAGKQHSVACFFPMDEGRP